MEYPLSIFILRAQELTEFNTQVLKKYLIVLPTPGIDADDATTRGRVPKGMDIRSRIDIYGCKVLIIDRYTNAGRGRRVGIQIQRERGQILNMQLESRAWPVTVS